MLFDTGAHGCIITEDILPQSFRDYLKYDPIHGEYRSADGTTVHVDAAFSFADNAVLMGCVFRVVPRSRVPNQRVGIILVQNTFIDYLVYKAIPRRILSEEDGAISEEVWGDILIHQYINVKGEIVKLL
jgi:hypothetical protein